MAEVIISVHNLEHIYPNGAKALKGVSLEIKEGEFIGLIGQNGSGKTTLVKHFDGLLRPTSGKYFLHGEDTSRMSSGKLALHVGYVFQNPDHQIFLNTVLDEIAFGLKQIKRHQNIEDIEQRARDTAAFMGLADVFDQHPQRLSRGQRQRLAIASILAMRPEVMILDEPTGGQDPQQTKNLMTMLLDLNRQGHTILLITHDLELAAAYCQRILVLRAGQLLLDGTPQEVFKETDKLASAHLRAPDIYRLSASLGNPVLSMDEFVAKFNPRSPKLGLAVGGIY